MRNLEYRSSTRRSDTNSQTRRQPLPFPDDVPFKILSIDGGGIRGIFPATILTYLEEQHLNGKPIGNYADIADMHIYPNESSNLCCLGINASKGHQIDIPAFINEMVVPFFYRISYVERYGLEAARNDLWGNIPTEKMDLTNTGMKCEA